MVSIDAILGSNFKFISCIYVVYHTYFPLYYFIPKLLFHYGSHEYAKPRLLPHTPVIISRTYSYHRWVMYGVLQCPQAIDMEVTLLRNCKSFRISVVLQFILNSCID